MGGDISLYQMLLMCQIDILFIFVSINLSCIYIYTYIINLLTLSNILCYKSHIKNKTNTF